MTEEWRIWRESIEGFTMLAINHGAACRNRKPDVVGHHASEDQKDSRTRGVFDRASGAADDLEMASAKRLLKGILVIRQ